jgi:hypothetical protein
MNKVTHQRILLATLVCAFATACAQAQTSPSNNQETVATNIDGPSAAGGLSAGSAIPLPDKAPARDSAVTSDDGWHLAISPYLWLAGTHGTLGARNRELSFKASPTDLLSNFRFGLMGVIDARRSRLLLPIDFIWIRLEDDKALPFPNLPATNANMKLDEFILTPKIGYRMLDLEKLKVDGLAGFRYWHVGQNLQFSPSTLGLNFSGSQNWIDPVVGMRFLGTVSPKVELTVAGDVGGGGVQSQLDYQIAGAIGYRFKPKWALQVGYRYLFVDYRSGGSTLNSAMAGAVLGVTYNLK